MSGIEVTARPLRIRSAKGVNIVVGGRVSVTSGPGAGSGDVVGPTSATDGAVPVYDGPTGKLLKNGVVLGTAAVADADDFATAAQGDLADTALQSGSGAGGDLSGTYPNPGLNESAVHALILSYIAAGQGVEISGVGDHLTISVGALAITSSTVVASEAEMLALTAQEGDVAIRTDTQSNWILGAGASTLLASWNQLLTPTDAVLSVSGKTGMVTLAIADVVGLQGALDAKVGTGDPRLSDARTPTAHKATHQSGGTDELALDAAQITAGTIAQARLGTGSGGAGTKFLADDQTYKTISAGSSGYSRSFLLGGM